MPDDIALDSETALKRLKETRDEDREDRYRAYREYYDGDHDTQLTDRQRQYLQLKVGEEFNGNYCPIVVDALVERLTVTGFETDESAQETFWEWWKLNRMDHQQGIVHTAAVRDGDSFVLVGWDNDEERPTFTFEQAFDGNEGAMVHYSRDTRKPMFASKQWEDDEDRKRLNLYFADRVERYMADDGGDWAPFNANGLPPVEDWGGMDNPLGVPLVHFAHRDQGYNFGRSDLRDVMPLQNAFNKAIIDLVAAADTTAFRIYTMLGDDPTDLDITPGCWVYSLKPPGGEDSAAIGHIPGEDLSKLIEFKDAFAMEIARVSRTPLSFFQISGHRPAEGTLKQEESGLVARASKAQVGFGNAWEDVMQMAAKLHNFFGGEGRNLPDDLQIDTQWNDPETRNDRTYYETLKVKGELGVPQEILWQEMDYSPEQIEDMKQSEEYQSRQASRAMLMEMSQGGGKGEAPPGDEEE